VKKGGKTMKRLLITTLALLLGAGAVQFAWADADPSNDSAALTITVTPNIDIGVTLDTSAVSGGFLSLGSVDLYASTQTVRPATMTIVGNLATQEVNLSATLTGGWKFDVSPSTWATSGETDALAAYAQFTSTTVATAPSGPAFNGAPNDALDVDATSFPSTRCGGGPSATGTRFEDGTTDMDNLAVGAQRHLWFYFRLPNQTSVQTQQSVKVTLTAQSNP